MCEGNDMWPTADHAVREIAPRVLEEAGYAYEASELRRLSPVDNQLNAEAACHVTLGLLDRLRGPMSARAHALVEHTMSVAFAASRGQRGAVSRYVHRMVSTGTRMLGAEWMLSAVGIAGAAS